ncbi:MAG: hypothetical protein GEV11_30160 [Streptosporangiales bacterium]|nr:hypothetical protein [Streptosporangiales bacterium]
MGREMTRLMLSLAAGEDDAPDPVILPTHLIPRAST